MKRISLLLALLLLLCAGCAKAPAEAELIFPPTEESLNAALEKAGLEWTVTVPQTDDPAALSVHEISNGDGSITGTVNSYDRGEGKNEIIISLGYNNQPDAVEKFTDEEWPEFWQLAGELMGAPEAAQQLFVECARFLSSHDGSAKYMLNYQGEADGIYCQVQYMSIGSMGGLLPVGLFMNNYQAYEQNYGK